MNIIHLSDTHNLHSNIAQMPCDLLIHTGDFCNLDFTILNNKGQHEERLNSYAQAMDFLAWLSVYPAKAKVVTSGNHETFLNDPILRLNFEQKCKEFGIIFKDDLSEIIEVEGIFIAGAGTYPLISDYIPKNTMTLKHAYELNKGSYSQIPNVKIDILLSHVPPKINDNNKECPDLALWIKKRNKDNLDIKFVLCGHVHSAKGIYHIERTNIINSAYNFQPVIIKL